MAKAQGDPRKYLPMNLKIPWRDVRLVVAAVVNEKGEFKDEAKAIDSEAEGLENGEDLHTWTTKEFVLDHVDFHQRLVPARLHDTVRIDPKVIRDPTYELNAAKRENPLLQQVFDDLESDPVRWSKGKLVHGYKWEKFRVIPGTSKEILDLSKDDADKDPSFEEDYDPEAQIHPGDTVQYDVEELTYRPQLTVQPFPASVLNELRNKHSRNAPVAQIDPAILDKRESRAAHVEAQSILREKKMRTPLQEIKERRLEIEKQVLEKRKLSDEELFAKLGSAMEKVFVSGGQQPAEQYLKKMLDQQEKRAAAAAALKQAKEQAAWSKKIAEENKKKIDPVQMKGHLRYEKVADFWPTDPAAREAQKAQRRAEKEASLIADAKIKQFELAKELLGHEQSALDARVQVLEKDVIAAQKKRDLQPLKRGGKAKPAVIARVPKLRTKWQNTLQVAEQKKRDIERTNLKLDHEVEKAERMKQQILSMAMEAKRAREAEERERLRWV
jgi:hypothetical protein